MQNIWIVLFLKDLRARVFLHGNQRICLHTTIFCSRQVAISENYIFNENNPVKDHDTDGDGDDEDGDSNDGDGEFRVSWKKAKMLEILLASVFSMAYDV